MKQLRKDLFKVTKKGKFTFIKGLKEKYSATILTAKFEKNYKLIDAPKEAAPKPEGNGEKAMERSNG